MKITAPADTPAPFYARQLDTPLLIAAIAASMPACRHFSPVIIHGYAMMLTPLLHWLPFLLLPYAAECRYSSAPCAPLRCR